MCSLGPRSGVANLASRSLWSPCADLGFLVAIASEKNVVDCSVAEISLDLSDLGSLSDCMSCLARFLSVSTSVCGRFPPTNWGPSPAHLNADFAGVRSWVYFIGFPERFPFQNGGRNNYFRSLQAHVQNWCILTLRFSFEDAPAS